MITCKSWESDDAVAWYAEDERFRRLVQDRVIRELQLRAGPGKQIRVSSLSRAEHPAALALDAASNERYRLVTWSAEVV